MQRFLTNRKRIIENNKETRKLQKGIYLSNDARKKLHLTHVEIKAVETKLLKHLQNQMFTTSKKKLSSFRINKNKDGLRRS